MPEPRLISRQETEDLIETMALDLFAVRSDDAPADTAIKAARYALLAYVMGLKGASRDAPEWPSPRSD